MKKIMFNDRYGLTDAVLAGRKTQTRRVVTESEFQRCRTNAFVEKGFSPDWETRCKELILINSYYMVGEVVAVAQSYSKVAANYAMNGEFDKIKFFPLSKALTNKMFVKAELMPHQICFTNRRVERLQEISDEDCLAEGIYSICDFYGFPDIKKYDWGHYKTPREAYASLIDKVSGKGTWDSNPWVLAYDFELVM